MKKSDEAKATSFYGDDRYPRKSVLCEDGATTEERVRKYAALAISPELAAYRVVSGAEKTSGLETNLDVPALIDLLREQAAEVQGGSLDHAEAMLANQAVALQTLFARLAERAMSSDTVVPFELNMRMALRAQSQCRATLETLAAVKNPPVVYAKQANVTSGPQQINNGVASDAGEMQAHARETRIAPNRLLEADNGERMDAATTGTASGVDKELATVGEIDRAKNG